MEKSVPAIESRIKSMLKALVAVGLILGAVQILEMVTGRTSTMDNGLFSLGFLLLAGTLGGRVSSAVGLPKLTGYLIAGFICGPSITGAISENQFANIRLVNSLALALIALQAGAEFTKEMLTKNVKVIAWGTLFHVLIIGTLISAFLYLFSQHLALFDGYSSYTILTCCILIGVVAIAKSPAVVVAVLSETKAKGRLSEYSLGMVVILDIVVLVTFSTALLFAGSSLSANSTISMTTIVHLLEEILLSVAAGTFFGIIIILYLWLVNREKLLFIVVTAYGVSALSNYLHYDTLLIFVIAGLTVTQFSNQSSKMIEAVDNLSSLVMIIFFATAGASLHLHALLEFWEIVLVIFVVRAALTYLSERVTHKVAKSSPVLRKTGYTAFVSQAGLAIGLATLINTRLPSIGATLSTLAISVIALNEVFGPILFKWGLSRAGEIPASGDTNG